MIDCFVIDDLWPIVIGSIFEFFIYVFINDYLLRLPYCSVLSNTASTITAPVNTVCQ